MITISDFSNALITHGLDTRVTLLKICVNLMMDSTILELICVLVFSTMYRIPMILRYDFN